MVTGGVQAWIFVEYSTSTVQICLLRKWGSVGVHTMLGGPQNHPGTSTFYRRQNRLHHKFSRRKKKITSKNDFKIKISVNLLF